ncbi:MAG: class I SAM-dependent methyltransferase [Bacillota bacterium]|jgi:SAM-dependent methyltransferase
MDAIQWIKAHLAPVQCTSDRFFYDAMESQSEYGLPVIYKAFDPGKAWHWDDRGRILDYLFATRGQGARLLDFGPGDGWPSLPVAPFAGEVVGADASARRVEVCAGNAARMGITNARFVHVPAAGPLPFEDESFDGVMVASSIEQTPDPRQTLREIHRVLRPGGRLRMDYEGLGYYRGGKEREVWLLDMGEACRVIIYDRHIEQERADQYGLDFAMSAGEVASALTAAAGASAGAVGIEHATPDTLDALRPAITGAWVCTLSHPSGASYARWLREIGFSIVRPTHNGGRFARELFGKMLPEDRSTSLEGVTQLLSPLVQVVVEMPAPVEMDPMITAVK